MKILPGVEKVYPVLKDDEWHCGKCSAKIEIEYNYCGMCGYFIDKELRKPVLYNEPVLPVKDSGGKWCCGQCGEVLTDGKDQKYCTKCGMEIKQIQE